MHQLLAFLLGFIAAFIGAIASGGGLISIPGLVFIGLPPVAAIATSRLNLLAGGSSAIYRYKKDGAVLWRFILPLLVLGIAAGVFGPRLVLHLNPRLLQRLIGIILLIMLPMMWLKKSSGTINIMRSKRRRLIGMVILTLVLFMTTTFGGGGGILLIYTFVYFWSDRY